MSDKQMRELVDGIPVPSFESTPFTQPPPLSNATVAMVTTAGLVGPGQEGWGRGDQSFRTLARDERALTLRHHSPNFDRSGLALDLNVVLPVDRLGEMVADGVIGALGLRNLSFQGALDETMETIRLDSGPAAAKLLRDDGVDVVLLTPI